MASNPYFSLAVLFVRGGRFRARAAGAGVAVGKKFSPAKPNANKNATYECGLESKGDAWVQFRSEYYLYAHHLSDLRRGNDFSAAVRRGVHRAGRGGIHRDDGFCPAAGRRPGLGLGKGRADVEVTLERRCLIRSSMTASERQVDD